MVNTQFIRCNHHLRLFTISWLILATWLLTILFYLRFIIVIIMMMVIIISLKVIFCKSACVKALKSISILCVCSLTPQPIQSLNPFTARVRDGVWLQIDHPIFVQPLLLKSEQWSCVLNRRNIGEHYRSYISLQKTDLNLNVQGKC